MKDLKEIILNMKANGAERREMTRLLDTEKIKIMDRIQYQKLWESSPLIFKP